jgi:hypothetical protein
VNILNLDNIAGLLLEMRDTRVILDSDVASLYNVETKRVNEAVKNNPEKFPDGYVFELNERELKSLRSKISSAKLSKTRAMPKAFTEKGLYMLATIIKSATAALTTISIIETFARLRELQRSIKEISETKNEQEKEKIIRNSGGLVSRIIHDDLEITDTETSVELNFAVVKLKHVVKRK